MIKPTVQLIRVTENPEDLIAYIARLTRNQHDFEIKDQGKYIRNLIDMGHLSVFEHASISFLIENVSRTMSHQHVRHRIGHAITQMSQRYVNEKDCDVIVPDSIQTSQIASILYDKISKLSKYAYIDLIGAGIPKEDARFILPQGTATKLVSTFNFRALMHYLDLRLKKDAQWEIREVATKMLNIVKEIAPNCFYKF